ncbi:hypothetical protein CLOP_g4773 [Closterium sp. NIES-67]|nr:hypothetical protein CLOP_g4773 [Closterium sp. NIES-67]
MSPSTASDPAVTLRGPWQRDDDRRVEGKDVVLKGVDLSHMTSCAPRVKHAADYEREEDAYWAAESPMAAAQASSNPPVRPDYKEALYDLANHSWRQLGDVHVISEGDETSDVGMSDEASVEKAAVASTPCRVAEVLIPEDAHPLTRQPSQQRLRSGVTAAAVDGSMAGPASIDGFGDPKAWVCREARGRASGWGAGERPATVGGVSRNTVPRVPCQQSIPCTHHEPPPLHDRRSSGHFSLFHFPVLLRGSATANEALPVDASSACPLTHAAGGGESEYRLFSRGAKGGRPGMATAWMGRAGGGGVGGLFVPVM